MKRSTALLLITLLSTGVIVADTAAPEAGVLGNAAALERNAGKTEESGEQSRDQSIAPEKTTTDDAELQPQEKGFFEKLQAAHSAVCAKVHEELAPKTPGEARAMVIGFAGAACIAAVLHRISTR